MPGQFRYSVTGFYGSGHVTDSERHARELARVEADQTGGARIAKARGPHILIWEKFFAPGGKEISRDEFQALPER